MHDVSTISAEYNESRSWDCAILCNSEYGIHNSAVSSTAALSMVAHSQYINENLEDYIDLRDTDNTMKVVLSKAEQALQNHKIILNAAMVSGDNIAIAQTKLEKAEAKLKDAEDKLEVTEETQSNDPGAINAAILVSSYYTLAIMLLFSTCQN